MEKEREREMEEGRKRKRRERICHPIQDTNIHQLFLSKHLVSPGKWKTRIALQEKWPVARPHESNFRGTEGALLLIMPQPLQGSSRNEAPRSPVLRHTAAVLDKEFMNPPRSTLVIHTVLVTSPTDARPLPKKFTPAGM